MAEKGNVLFVSYHFPPSVSPGSLRVTTIVRKLDKKGWKVSVISAKRTDRSERDLSSLRQVPDDVKVRRTRSIELYRKLHKLLPSRRSADGGGHNRPETSRRGNGSAAHQDRPASRARPASGFRKMLKRGLYNVYQMTRFPDKQVGWYFPLVSTVRRLVAQENIDVVFSSSPPHSSQLAVLAARKRRPFKWVADFRDPWTAPSRRPKTRLSAFIQRRMEKTVLERCDLIIANTPGNKAALEKSFPSIDPAKIEVVTNGFDPDQDVDRQELPPGALECDLMYVGEVYAEMLELLVNALCIIRDRHPESLPRIHVFGHVDEREFRKIEESGLENHFVHKGFVSWDQSLRLMREARALLLLLPFEQQWTTCVPSKLYPYMQAGKPILALVPRGDAATILEDTGTGVTVTTGEAESTAEAIRGFIEDLRASRLVMERKPDRIEEYSMDRLTDKIDVFLTGLAKN